MNRSKWIKATWPLLSFLFALPIYAVEPPLTLATVASGLNRPTYVTHAGNDTTRLWVTEQPGKIKLIKNGAVLATPFMDAVGVVTGFTGMTALEYGLLSICFHPNYAQNGYFYICATTTSPTSGPVLMRFKRMANDPDRADTTSGVTILHIDYTSLPNHRSAWMDFGPDGYLYYNTGDGAENDPGNWASNLNSLRGKILRIDVNGADGIPGTADDDGFPADSQKLYQIPQSNPYVGQPGIQPEIFAYGLRNPWRASFDRLTHDLYIGDVGQLTREEVSFIPAGSPGGVFFGWHCKEGNFTTGYAGCPATLPPSSPPIFEYRGGVNATIIGGSSVIGGYVYRGCAIPELGGTYIFGDWGGSVASFRYSVGTGVTNALNRTASIGISGNTISSFGEDALGEILICKWHQTDGAILKIVPTTPQGPDCNANGKRDTCDLAAGTSLDANANGVPDECECGTCNGDTTGDGFTDALDIQRFASCAGATNMNGPGCRCANMNADAAVNAADVPIFIDKLLGTTDPDPACP